MNGTITKRKITELESMLSTGTCIAVTSHTHPDGDALGSVTAMRSYLESRGAQVRAVLPDTCPDSISFIDAGGNTIYGDGAKEAILKAGLVICLDFNNFSRAGSLAETLAGSTAPKILIDHHLNPDTGAFDLVFSDSEVSSTCELLYYILKSLPDIGGDAGALPEECAGALMAGMTTDSNNFANSVYPGTLRMASELLAAGVDRDAIIENLYNRYRVNRVKAISFMLSKRLKICGNGFAYMILDKAAASRFGLEEGETEGLVNIPLSIGEVKVSALFKEDKGHYRVSLRSRKGICVNGFAAEFFHGGGHAQASGGKLYFPGDISDRRDAARYIEDAAARFLQDHTDQI